MIYISKKRRKEIKLAVLSVLKFCETLTLPVNIKYIVKNFPNVRLIPYSRHMKKFNLSYEEMLEFADHGYENIVIVQPFGCLPCHVAAKGMINKVRRIDPRLNVVDIEYDPGATKVNQENRIKLMLVVAKEKLQ